MDKYFFPGGNTPHGFVNCFDDILPQYAARRVYYVKGGSGVGKSTLMRRVGERYQRQGWDVEYFNCSSDPASLDGVALPALGVALMDATPPHLMEPRLPGLRDFTLDLAEYLDEARLTDHKAELEAVMSRRAGCFEQAYAWLRAALPLYENAGRLYAGTLRPAAALAADIERALDVPGVDDGAALAPRRLFAGAISPDGFVSTLETLRAGNCIRIELPWGCDASEALELVARRHPGRTRPAVLLLNPMRPERTIHLLLPECDALITADGGLQDPIKCDAVLSGVSGAIPDEAARAAAAFDQREFTRLIEAAVSELRRARKLHADVERVYSAAMNFDAVGARLDAVYGELDALLPQN